MYTQNIYTLYTKNYIYIYTIHITHPEQLMNHQQKTIRINEVYQMKMLRNAKILTNPCPVVVLLLFYFCCEIMGFACVEEDFVMLPFRFSEVLQGSAVLRYISQMFIHYSRTLCTLEEVIIYEGMAVLFIYNRVLQELV